MAATTESLAGPLPERPRAADPDGAHPRGALRARALRDGLANRVDLESHLVLEHLDGYDDASSAIRLLVGFLVHFSVVREIDASPVPQLPHGGRVDLLAVQEVIGESVGFQRHEPAWTHEVVAPRFEV